MRAFQRSRTKLLVGILLVLSLSPLSAQEKPDALRSYRLGRDLEARGRMDDASARYDQAVSICLQEIDQNATNMDSYTVLTWALLRQKKYKDVLDWGAKALKINQNDYRVIESIGEAYFYLDNYKESLKHMERYVDSAPQGERVSTAYFFMGEIYRIQRQNQHADIAYSTAVRMEPSISLWWYRLALARENAGDYQRAVDALNKALALNPNYTDAQDVLARVKKRLSA